MRRFETGLLDSISDQSNGSYMTRGFGAPESLWRHTRPQHRTQQLLHQHTREHLNIQHHHLPQQQPSSKLRQYHSNDRIQSHPSATAYSLRDNEAKENIFDRSKTKGESNAKDKTVAGRVGDADARGGSMREAETRRSCCGHAETRGAGESGVSTGRFGGEEKRFNELLTERDDDGSGDSDRGGEKAALNGNYLAGFQNAKYPCQRHRACPDEIMVEKIRARVDRRPVVIDEKTPAVVVFKSPPFKAAARVSLPAMLGDESWTIGWIQACSKMKFRITYGTEGYSSWEFPQLKTQSMISDSDGRNFPWYGGNKEIAHVAGPRSATTVEVRMTDSFAPRVTWLPPFYPQPFQERVDIESQLTRIHRDQSFYTWLVARNERTRVMVVLATIKWRAFIDVAFDPKAPIGQRGTVIGDGYPKFQPEILLTNEPIPLCALSPPHANEAQILVWRRHGSQSEEVLIPSALPPSTTHKHKSEPHFTSRVFYR